ncbi:MAG TPA: hypothetical protein VK994_06995 [Bacteroidales bacterium]|nr:hypothetical protein [Bacteroidales bacterium]
MLKANNIVILIAALLLGISTLKGQENAKKSEWGIRLGGFVNAQAFFDSRQIVESREGMVSLFPRNARYDPDGKDINARAGFNQAAMTTRLRGTISGPDALGATTSGVIETDFTGSSNSDNNGLRLREAWVRLEWKRFDLLIGQYWHPLYVAEVGPKTIGLNLGAPFHPFARHNQVRISYGNNRYRIIAVAASQRDYSNNGPDGRTPKYIRNAVVPNLDLQVRFTPDNMIIGAGVDYKLIKPRQAVDFGPSGTYSTNEKIGSFALTAFAMFELPQLLVKSQAVWGQNLTEFIMLGGYVEKDIDSVSHTVTYASTSQFSFWADLSTRGKVVKFGFLGGYARNLGYSGPAEGAYYGTGSDIAYLYRLSPRVEWYSGKLMLALEIEYTGAGYGEPDSDGIVNNINEYRNMRCLAAAFLFF